MGCLILRGLSSINDENIIKLGELVVHRSEVKPQNWEFHCSSLSPITYTIVGDNTFVDGSKEKNSTDIVDKLANSNECNIIVSDKYLLKYINCDPNIYSINLEDIKACYNLTFLRINLIGDIINIKHLNKLTYLDISPTNNDNCYGDIAEALKNSIDFNTMITINTDKIYGDLSKMPPKFLGFNHGDGKRHATFSWKGERSHDSYIMAFHIGFNLGEDIDKMLINQSKCVNSIDLLQSWVRNISVNGTSNYKTDTEVQDACRILIGYGFDVVINGTNMKNFLGIE